MKSAEKAFIGVLGGLAAVCVKFLGQDYYSVVTQVANLTSQQILSYKIGYAILTPMLMFLGGLLSWVSDETNKLKLLAISVAAPALITTWSGGAKPKDMAFHVNPVGIAYAGETEKASTEKNGTVAKTVSDGVKIFFGYGKEVQRYYVIVGSYKTREDALRFVERINRIDKELRAYVGPRVEPNDYYPVVVGDYEPLVKANKLKDRALKLPMIKSAYLSPGAIR